MSQCNKYITSRNIDTDYSTTSTKKRYESPIKTLVYSRPPREAASESSSGHCRLSTRVCHTGGLMRDRLTSTPHHNHVRKGRLPTISTPVVNNLSTLNQLSPVPMSVSFDTLFESPVLDVFSNDNINTRPANIEDNKRKINIAHLSDCDDPSLSKKKHPILDAETCQRLTPQLCTSESSSATSKYDTALSSHSKCLSSNESPGIGVQSSDNVDKLSLQCSVILEDCMLDVKRSSSRRVKPQLMPITPLQDGSVTPQLAVNKLSILITTSKQRRNKSADINVSMTPKNTPNNANSNASNNITQSINITSGISQGNFSPQSSFFADAIKCSNGFPSVVTRQQKASKISIIPSLNLDNIDLFNNGATRRRRRRDISELSYRNNKSSLQCNTRPSYTSSRHMFTRSQTSQHSNANNSKWQDIITDESVQSDATHSIETTINTSVSADDLTNTENSSVRTEAAENETVERDQSDCTKSIIKTDIDKSNLTRLNSSYTVENKISKYDNSGINSEDSSLINDLSISSSTANEDSDDSSLINDVSVFSSTANDSKHLQSNVEDTSIDNLISSLENCTSSDNRKSRRTSLRTEIARDGSTTLVVPLSTADVSEASVIQHHGGATRKSPIVSKVNSSGCGDGEQEKREITKDTAIYTCKISSSSNTSTTVAAAEDTICEFLVPEVTVPTKRGKGWRRSLSTSIMTANTSRVRLVSS